MPIAVPSPRSVRDAERILVRQAADQGEPDRLMLRAARAVAARAMDIADKDEEILAIAGGGDNGGDALYAAAFLKEFGYSVKACLATEHPHERALAAAKDAGVEVSTLSAWTWTSSPTLDRGDLRLLRAPIWIDGIIGTGLMGPLHEPTRSIIDQLATLAHSYAPTIIAVDLPSGMWHEDGAIDGPTLRADTVVTMGAVKSPLVLPPACYSVGEIHVVDLGLGPDLPPYVEVLTAQDIAEGHLIPGTSDHKYTRGVVCAAVGSRSYPGAGVLAVEGALGAGPGMVRLLADPRVESLVLARRPGVVTVPGRFQAGVVGPGMDEDARPRAEALAAQCMRKNLPIVVDAEALGLVSSLLRAHGPLRRAILTPHAGEAAALLSALDREKETTRADVEAAPVAAATRLARLTGGCVVLKGARTVIAGADGKLVTIPTGSGWAGVAGSGDVLAGVLATLAAAAEVRAEKDGAGVRPDLVTIAARGAWIHAEAARRAAHTHGNAGGPIQPEDIAATIASVIGQVLT
ncbi:MAG: NAD(P)H-hydrate epimerase [Actinomycetaceae bacterium]|nr:NAD(P)H-hydrate epimerase [Actinomycetaceae bacterium]